MPRKITPSAGSNPAATAAVGEALRFGSSPRRSTVRDLRRASGGVADSSFSLESASVVTILPSVIDSNLIVARDSLVMGETSSFSESPPITEETSQSSLASISSASETAALTTAAISVLPVAPAFSETSLASTRLTSPLLVRESSLASATPHLVSGQLPSSIVSSTPLLVSEQTLVKSSLGTYNPFSDKAIKLEKGFSRAKAIRACALLSTSGCPFTTADVVPVVEFESFVSLLQRRFPCNKVRREECKDWMNWPVERFCKELLEAVPSEVETNKGLMGFVESISQVIINFDLKDASWEDKTDLVLQDIMTAFPEATLAMQLEATNILIERLPDQLIEGGS